MEPVAFSENTNDNAVDGEKEIRATKMEQSAVLGLIRSQKH